MPHSVPTVEKNCLYRVKMSRVWFVVGRTGFGPATFCTSSRCPNQARRPAHCIFYFVADIFKVAVINLFSRFPRHALCCSLFSQPAGFRFLRVKMELKKGEGELGFRQCFCASYTVDAVDLGCDFPQFLVIFCFDKNC